jgi:hypothetical protein
MEGHTFQLPNEKYKKTNNDLQNTTQKTRDCATRTPQTGGEHMCCGGVSRSYYSSGTRRVAVERHERHLI